MPINLSNRGLNCNGSLAIRTKRNRNPDRESCPYDMTVDLDTSPLVAWRLVNSVGDAGLMLGMRCHFCHTKFKLREVLRRCRALADNDNDRAICEWVSCFNSALHLAKYCFKHLEYVCIAKKWKDPWNTIVPERAKLVLRKGLAPPSRQWSSAGIAAFAQISRKFKSGAKVNAIVLDLEFNTEKVHMAAACDLFTGEKLFDTWLDNEWTNTSCPRVPDSTSGATDIHKQLDIARKIRTTDLGHMERSLVRVKGKERINAINAKQLVAELERANIDSDTFVFSWATSSATDLGRLSNWIDKRITRGTKNPLPPISMCIPLINIFRHNIIKNVTAKEAEDLTLALEVVFPSVFPQEHTLIGFNHQPLIDCLQARLLGLQALRYSIGDEPLDNLVYNVSPVAILGQRGINAHFTRANERDKGSLN